MKSEDINPSTSVFIVDRVDLDGEFPVIYLQEMIIDGYQSYEEQSDAVRDVQELYTEDDNLQSVSQRDTLGNTFGSVRPQSSASKRRGDTIRTRGGQETVLSTEGTEQENRQVNRNTPADSNESASFMPENGAQFEDAASSNRQIAQNPITQQIVSEGVYNNINPQLQSGASGGIINGNGGVDNARGQIYNGSQRFGREGGNSQVPVGTLQADTGRASGSQQEGYGRDGGLSDLSNQGNNRGLTPEQSESLKTTAIKNEDGTPKTVYHFTDNMEFETFAEGDIGFHFGSEAQAQQRKLSLKSIGRLNGEGRIIKAYLDIKNPVYVSSDIMVWQASQTAIRLWCDGVISKEEHIKIRDMQIENGGTYNTPAATELRRILAEKGYDGIVYKNSDFFEGEGESYIAFYPEQVVIVDDGKGNTLADFSKSASFMPENGAQESFEAQEGTKYK